VVDDRDPVGEGVGLGHVVGDEQDCLPGGLQSGDDVVDGQADAANKRIADALGSTEDSSSDRGEDDPASCRPRPGTGTARAPASRGYLTRCAGPAQHARPGPGEEPRLEGLIRGHMYTDGARRDSLLYSLLADERAAG
jgi:hypothetical protein